MTLWRVRATVDDRPGFLAVLTASLALRSVNILSVQVHTTEVGVVDEFLIDAPDLLSERDLVEAIERGRGRDAWVRRSDAKGLIDEPTRVLSLASRIAADPQALEPTLTALLSLDSVTWLKPGAGPAREGCTPHALQLIGPDGRILLARRAAPAFTPAEYARAQALVAVALVAARAGRPESSPA